MIFPWCSVNFKHFPPLLCVIPLSILNKPPPHHNSQQKAIGGGGRGKCGGRGKWGVRGRKLEGEGRKGIKYCIIICIYSVSRKF